MGRASAQPLSARSHRSPCRNSAGSRRAACRPGGGESCRCNAAGASSRTWFRAGCAGISFRSCGKDRGSWAGGQFQNSKLEIQNHAGRSHRERMSGDKLEFDLAVMGGGSGGYAAARTAAAAGLRTAVLEGGKEVGGLCILRGCMPSKALLYAAEVRHLALYAGLWGMKPGDVPFDWGTVMARKDSLIKQCTEDRVAQLNDGRFKFIRAQARFGDPHTVSLSTGGTLSAAHFVISTGSVVSPPPLPQLAAVGYITSDEALTLRRPPKSLLVLGGGAVAVELAQFFARFDVKVTLIQR